MPILLTNPITGPVVTRMEVIGFTVDLSGGFVGFQFAHLTDAGEIIGQSAGGASLYTPEGAPRFTPQEYASIKAAVYRLAIEDGLVAGTVE